MDDNEKRSVLVDTVRRSPISQRKFLYDYMQDSTQDDGKVGFLDKVYQKKSICTPIQHVTR